MTALLEYYINRKSSFLCLHIDTINTDFENNYSQKRLNLKFAYSYYQA